VRFLGEQEDVTPFYQAADVSLILSRGEASSLTALESLACEVPVIVARRPPFDELITDDCGVLVDEEDTDAVAGAVEGMLANPEQRALMGQCGRALVQEKFSWGRAAEEYIKVMASAVQPA
jgi:glycosyltransferase involved in cell wall biosynthesis